MGDNPDGIVKTHVVCHGGVTLGFKMSTDDDESAKTLIHLSAKQAEALATDLLEQARAQKKDHDADQSPAHHDTHRPHKR